MPVSRTPEVMEVLDELTELTEGMQLLGNLLIDAKKDVDYLAFMSKGRLEGEVAKNAQQNLAKAIKLLG